MIESIMKETRNLTKTHGKPKNKLYLSSAN